MEYFNVIIRKRDNSNVADFLPYVVESAELTAGNYVIIYHLPDDATTYTATYAETDYIMYIVSRYEYVD